MASNKDLEIASTSYVNKDFASIYPDMLDLAKKITNRWDPSQSNESDPGVVLLKEAAFVADHNNYNIDKNILENFLPSATQDKSVRNICEMNGYTPRYYVAATGEIVLYYTFESEDAKQSFNVPRFTYVISNDDESVSYTQLNDLQIIADDKSKGSIQAVCQFIEGTLQTLLINDSSTITMENLDDNNRVYLPEVMVAQNGVFIKNINTEDYNDYWERDNYLLTQPIGSRKFKLDYDSDMMLPYIEFPSDISNLIGDGLTIQYISTSGEAGNVSANTLTKIISPTTLNITDQITGTTLEVLSSQFEINNLGSISNGKNPETIDEMYQSFRKTVGTFETLITCLDYSNYIFNMEDSMSNPFVSNAYVTDRRTDYNKACNVVTFDENGVFFKNISIEPCRLMFKGVVNSLSEDNVNQGDMVVYNEHLYVYLKSGFKPADVINLNDFALLSEAMTPYDLVIYALKTFALADYNRLEPSKAFNESFKPVSYQTKAIIENELDKTKCISHTFKSEWQDDIFCFKNYEPLKIVITPYNVIETEVEGNDIINNVYIAISNNFNPRHLNFGEDINLTDVKKVIINCDDRIKDVDITKLYETNINDFTRAMDNDGENYDMNTIYPFNSGKTSILVDLIAKNVLAGRVCLFEFDKSFNMTYGQSDGKIINNISKIETELPISVTKSENLTSDTTNQIVQKYILTSTGGDDIWYEFNAPLYTKKDSTERLDLGNRMTCTLKVSDDKKTVDTLTIYRLNELSGVIESTSYNSKENTIDLEVNFVNDGDVLKNEKRSKLTDKNKDNYKMPAGTLTISVKSIVSSTESGTKNVEYTLKDNESVQIIYPNYYSDKSYGMYINYRYISQSNNVIRANTEHVLRSDEQIVFVYTVDGTVKQDVYGTGTIINSSFDLAVTDNQTSSGVKKSWVDNNGFYHDGDKFKTMSSNQTISTRVLMDTKLTNPNVRCYWITDTGTLEFNSITIDNKVVYEKILNDNEYFIYTNSTFSEMMILGSGTLLRKNSSDNWSISLNNKPTIESITENGVNANIPWQSLDFANDPLTIIEMNIITLGGGDSITISSWDDAEVDDDGNVKPINNDWKFCNANITYSVESGDTTMLSKTENFYRIRSHLNLMIGPGYAQELQPGQTVTITGDEKFSAVSPYKLQCNKVLNNVNGYTNFSNLSDVSIYIYRDDLETVSGTSILLGGDSEGRYPFFYDSTLGSYLIPIYVAGDNEDVSINASFTDSEGRNIKFKDFNGVEVNDTMSLEGNSLYLLQPNPDNTSMSKELYLKLNGWEGNTVDLKDDVAIVVSDFKIIKNDSTGNAKLNDLISDNVAMENVLSRIKEIISGSDHPSIKPYYIYEPDNSTKINLEKYSNKISSSNSTSITYKNKAFDNQDIMWDVNNVANQMTIPQIDLDASNIEINSLLRGY